MKLKSLLALAMLVAGGGSLWAQTDVTSTYITNPSFEYSASGTASSAQALTNGGTYYGWTLPNLGASYVNISIGNSSACNGQAFGIPTAKDGSFYYFNRRGWNSSTSADGTLSTTMSSVPVGHYEVTIWYKGYERYNSSSGTAAHKTNGSYLKVTAVQSDNTLASFQTANFDKIDNKDNASYFSGENNWKSLSFTFDVATQGDVTLNIIEHLVGGVRADVVIDNVKLIYTSPELYSEVLKLQGTIKKATALNTVLTNDELTAEIETATGMLSTLGKTVSDIESEISKLEAYYPTTTISITNGDFNTDVNISLDGTNSASFIEPATAAKPYIYPVSGWTQAFTFNSTAAQGNTAVYGAAISGDKGNNGTNPPASDIYGLTSGGTLHISSGWSDQARYQQDLPALNPGRYILYYEANNQNSGATSINSNYFGLSNLTANNVQGTSNAFIYSDLKSFPYNEWTSTATEFNLIAPQEGAKMNVGVIGTTGGSASGAKLWVDNVTLYYLGWDSTDALASLHSSSETAASLLEKAMNASVKTALENAQSDADDIVEAGSTDYNEIAAAQVAISGAISNAQASVALYESLNTAISNVEGWTSDAPNVTAPIRSKYTNGEYADDATPSGIYEEYQAAEIAALAAASATDYTSAIINPSFETGDMTGWNAESRGDTGVKEQSNGTYSISNGVDGSYLFNSWGGTAENNVYQTIKNLPAGTYTLSALLAGFNGEILVLAANETTNSVTVAGDKTVGNTVNVVFTLANAADVVIKASNTKSQDGSDASFIKADYFRLTAGDVTTDDYTALNAAIEAAETKTIGFDEGEYAPYNNVAALAALKAAKAVDQSVSMLQTDLDAIVNALTNATWTVNATEVNAFYDGNFTIQPEHTTGPTALTGWNNPEGIRQLIKNTTTYPGLTSATGQAAVFAWGNTTMTYGDAEGYTLPLNAHTIYELSFKTCGWSDGDMGYVNVDIKNASNEGLQTVATATATKRITESEPWNEFRILFVTGEAGNYKFGMWTSKHTTFTDLSIVKAVSQTLTLPSATQYAAGTYPTVTLNRTFSDSKWNTLCAPFAFDKSNFAAVKVLSSVAEVAGDVNMTFADADDTVAAGTPCLVKATNNGDGLTVTDVTIDPAAVAGSAEATVSTTTVTYQGTYTGITLNGTDNSNAWVVSNNMLYNVDSGVTVGAYRAYFTVATSGAVKALNFDFGNATGINSIANSQQPIANSSIYNLAGQRMSKMQRGINIVNGKKIYVK